MPQDKISDPDFFGYSSYPDLAKLEKEVQRKTMPIPAGAAPPVILRALDKLRTAYPADMVGVRAKDMPWNDREAFSDVLAGTPISGSIEHRETPAFNPAMGMLANDWQAQRTMAHELEHIRQGRNEPDAMKALREFSIPYEERPSEIAARKAADDYDSLMGDSIQSSSLEGTGIPSYLQRRALQDSLIHYAGKLFQPK